MKYWKAGIIFLISYLIQTNLLNGIAIYGYTPNLMLAFTVAITFLYGEEPYAMVFSVILGLIYDMCYGTVIGPTAIALLLACAFIRMVRYIFNVDNFVNMLITSVFAIAIYYLSYWGIVGLFDVRISFMRAMGTMIFSGIYTLVVVVISYMIMHRLIVKRRKERKFR